MALTDLKFESADFTNQDVASLPDRPGDSGMTAAQLKARFDNVGKVLLALGNYNLLIDELVALDIEDGVISEDIRRIRLNADNVIETSNDGVTWAATGSSGHVILDYLGNTLTQRSRLKFANCTITDDGTNTVINGIKGETGATGASGPQGVKGETGPRGLQGPSGVQGIQGNQGTQGIQGPSGITGPAGPTGAQGPQGTQGDQGPQGMQGVQGIQGAQGAQGVQGEQGPQGDPTTVNNKTGLSITLGGADIALTGYSKPGAASAIAATDDINAAFGKLEKEMDGKTDLAGGTMTGALVAQSNSNYTSPQVRNMIMSAASPSGGSNGDVWLMYV